MKASKAWARFLRKVDVARSRLGCARPTHGKKGLEQCEDAWFRGLSKSSHKLLPSLFRCFKAPNSEKQWRKVREAECDLFYEFSARARELHGSEMTDWDILFAMQHYGTPTRLLDWTESFGVAVYFACEAAGSDADDPPCVWVMNPFRLNNLSWARGADLVAPQNLGWEEINEHPEGGMYWEYGEIVSEGLKFDWNYPVAIYPRQQTNRMHAQRAWFTIHGDEHIALEKAPGISAALQPVELPVDAFPAARDFLEDAGINIYSVYPDLVNLSRHLRLKYGL